MTLLNFDNLTPGESGKESEAEVERQAARLENHVHAIIKLAISEIEKNYNGRKYKSTEEIRRAEDHVDLVAKAILAGQSELDELRAACAAWVDATKPAPGEK
jgi:hypothetical protein